MSGVQNVVQFPLRRVLPAQVDAAFAAVPDVREIGNLVDAFRLEMPGEEVRQQVEAEVAQFVLSNVPAERGARREAALRELLAEYASAADAAAEVARVQWVAANDAQERVVERQRDESERAVRVYLDHANEITAEAAQSSVTAYRLALEASAAARVVSMALRGEEWRPFDLRETAAELFGLDVIERSSRG